MRRKAVVAGVLGLAVAGVGAAVSTLRWRPENLGPSGEAPGPLEPGDVRAVTFNAWKLSDPVRVPRYVRALERTGALLAADAPALPELFAVQEIESRDALAALREEVAPTHALVSCECAVGSDGRLRSAVALGVSRERFEVRGERCVELGRVWPDHPRCAVRVDLADETGETLQVLGVHMAWHLDNASMARRVREAIDPSRPTVLLGDFNTWSGRSAYDRLAAPPLRDVSPRGGPTTVIDRRVDLVLVSEHLEVGRTLNRRDSYDAVRPTSSLTLPGFPFGLTEQQCEDDPAACPVSDHLPEGAVLRLSR